MFQPEGNIGNQLLKVSTLSTNPSRCGWKRFGGFALRWTNTKLLWCSAWKGVLLLQEGISIKYYPILSVCNVLFSLYGLQVYASFEVQTESKLDIGSLNALVPWSSSCIWEEWPASSMLEKMWSSFDRMILRRLEWHSCCRFTGLIRVNLQVPWSGRLYQWSAVQIAKLWQLLSWMLLGSTKVLSLLKMYEHVSCCLLGGCAEIDRDIRGTDLLLKSNFRYCTSVKACWRQQDLGLNLPPS